MYAAVAVLIRPRFGPVRNRDDLDDRADGDCEALLGVRNARPFIRIFLRVRHEGLGFGAWEGRNFRLGIGVSLGLQPGVGRLAEIHGGSTGKPFVPLSFGVMRPTLREGKPEAVSTPHGSEWV